MNGGYHEHLIALHLDIQVSLVESGSKLPGGIILGEFSWERLSYPLIPREQATLIYPHWYYGAADGM